MTNYKNRVEDFTISRVEDEASGEDHVRLEFEKTGGRTSGRIDVPISSFIDDRLLKKALLDHGYAFPLHEELAKRLFKMLRDGLPAEAGKLCESTGWKDVGNGQLAFLLPTKVVAIGNDDTGLELTSERAALSTAKGCGGTMSEATKLLRGAGRSDFAAMAILVSLAAPLYRFASLEEGFIFNLAGNGSSGKSTANRVAASIWGNPNELPSWSATERATFELAAANSDMVLTLDDIERAQGKAKDRLSSLELMIHTLPSGKSRSYARIVAGPLPQLRFNSLVLASSPLSVEDHHREAGTERTDGDRARLLEVRVPHGDDGGIWKAGDLKGVSKSSRELSDICSTYAKAHYGHVGEAWVRYLVDHQGELRAEIQRLSAKFLASLGEQQSVQGRIAAKIGFVYAAGRLAINADLLPWTKERVKFVARRMFVEVAATAFELSPLEREAFAQLRNVISDNNRFPIIARGSSVTDAVAACEGFRKPDENRIFMKSASFVEIATPDAATDEEARVVIASVRNQIDGAKALLAGHGAGRLQDVRVGKAKKKQGYLAFDEKALNVLFAKLLP